MISWHKVGTMGGSQYKSFCVISWHRVGMAGGTQNRSSVAGEVKWCGVEGDTVISRSMGMWNWGGAGVINVSVGAWNCWERGLAICVEMA